MLAFSALPVALAHGQSPGLGTSVETESAEDRTPPSAVAADPHIDNHWLAPTALVQPAGSVTVTNHMGIIHSGVTFGLGNAAQISVETLPFALAVDGGNPNLGISGKIVLADRGPTRVAMFGRGLAIDAKYSTWWHGEVGGTTSYCFTADCSSLVSVAASLGVFGISAGSLEDGDGHRNVFARVAAGLLLPLHPQVKLVGDVEFVANEGEFLAVPSAGLRLHGASWALQAVVLYGVKTRKQYSYQEPMGRYETFPTPVPWLNAAYRWN